MSSAWLLRSCCPQMKRGDDRGHDCQTSTRRVELVHNLGDVKNRGDLGGAAIPNLYIAWSLWLLAMGIALIA